MALIDLTNSLVIHNDMTVRCEVTQCDARELVNAAIMVFALLVGYVVAPLEQKTNLLAKEK